jgi:hypothetical protein
MTRALAVAERVLCFLIGAAVPLYLSFYPAFLQTHLASSMAAT